MIFSKKIHLAKRHWYGVTNSIRVMPDFIVIGAAKSATTSLYHYFKKHPNKLYFNPELFYSEFISYTYRF